MKNKHFERRREAAKRYKKTRNRGGDVDGVSIIHSYAEPKALSYWDDFSFVLGSQRIIVTWVHPRMAYMSAAEDEADEIVLREHGPAPEWNLFSKNKVVHKRVGKSRKKVQYYEGSAVPLDYKTYYDTVRAETERLKLESTITIKPSIHLMQWATGRNVDITYPVELLNETQVIAFAKLLKSHLQGHCDLFAGLADYSYTAADWQRDHPKEPS